jgi:hypothetical protein
MRKVETPKSFARSLSGDMLECRAFGHTRENARVTRDGVKGGRVTFTCTRCGAVRWTEITRDGYLTGRSQWVYPEGYASPIGRIDRDGNAAMRMEFMRRMFELFPS